MELQTVFKALSDETRLRTLALLMRGELCVCQIASVLGLSQPSASKHLHRLSAAGIIRCRKVSQWCFYSICNAFKAEYADLHAFLNAQFKKHREYTTDSEILTQMIESSICCREVLDRMKPT